MSSQGTNDVAAVVEALRSHDRFLLTTHENPDGDALGSLLAAKLALDQLGKDDVMVLYGDSPLPGEYAFMELGDLLDRKSTRLNSSHPSISYAVFCLKKKK